MSLAKQAFYLHFAYAWPRLKSTAASERVVGLMKLFNQQRLNTHFVCSGSSKDRKFDAIHPLNFASSVCLDNNDHRALDDHFKKIDLNLVKFALFDTFIAEEFYSHHVYRLMPTVLRILDTQDLHSLRKFRQSSFFRMIADQTETSQTFDNIKISDIAAALPNIDDPIYCREILSILRSDLTIVTSDFEQMFLERVYGIKNVIKSQFFYDHTNYQPQEKAILPIKNFANRDKKYDFANRKNFVWIGSFLHEPNTSAVECLLQYIWPRIHARLPQSQLHIYGAEFPKKFENIESIEGVRKMNLMQDLKSLSKYKVLLAPIFYGAGIKGKITDSWDNYLPVATTPIGAEGLFKESYDNDCLLSSYLSKKDFSESLETLVDKNEDIIDYYKYDQWRVAESKDKLTFGGLFAANSKLISYCRNR
jgi:hypothetical protein